MSDERPRCACGKPARSSGGGYFGKECSACYQRRYRADPEVRARHREAVARYEAANPEKRRVWVRNYRERVGLYVPDLTALFAALGDLDRAVAYGPRRGKRGQRQRFGPVTCPVCGRTRERKRDAHTTCPACRSRLARAAKRAGVRGSGEPDRDDGAERPD